MCEARNQPGCDRIAYRRGDNRNSGCSLFQKASIANEDIHSKLDKLLDDGLAGSPFA